ncbi:MAG: TetR/AcrR family transcriptional regulator [Pseudomonadota bacterium]
MPKLNPQAMAQRRRRIAEAAYRCFVREGYAAASVDSICAEAGISKGAFYVHFASKDALLHAVAELRSAEIGPLAGATLSALADTIVDTLLGEMLSREAAHFELAAMIASTADPVLHARLVANLDAIGARIAEALDRIAGSTGARYALPAADAAMLVESYCLGLIVKAGTWTPDTLDTARAGMRHLLTSFDRAGRGDR